MADTVIGEMLYKITGDISALKRAMAESETTVRKTANTVSEQFRRISTEASVFGDATGGLAKKQEVLKNKINELIAQGINPANKGFQNLLTQWKAGQVELDRYNSKMSVMRRVMGGIGGIFAVGALVAFGKKIVGLASDAEETKNKFDVVFGGINEAANKASENLVKNWGYSTQGAQALLATSGDLYQAFGIGTEKSLELADTVARLSTDITSFKNVQGGAAQVVDAVNKAILNEAESAKMLGLILSDTAMKEFAATMGKNWDALSKGERAFLIVQKATKDAKNAIGDYANTQNSFANMTRRMEAVLSDSGASIGKDLLPALGRLGSVFLGAASDGGVLSFALKGLGKTLGAIVEIVSVSINAFGILSNSFKSSTINAARVAVDNAEKIKASGKGITETQDQYNARLKAADEILRRYKPMIDDYNRSNDMSTKSIKESMAALQGVEQPLNNATKSNAQLAAEQQNVATSGKEKNKILSEEVNYWQSISAAANQALATIGQQPQYINNMSNELGLVNQAMSDFNQYWEDLGTRSGARAGAIASSLNPVIDILNNISALQQANAQAQIDNLDRQMQKELEAAGLAQDSAVETAEKELAEALRTGDAKQIKAAQDALKRAQIEEKYARRKAKMEYEMALNAWKMQRVQVIAQGAQAVLSAYSSAAAIPFIGWILAPIAAAAAGIAAAIQIATVQKSKPQPPAFEFGGIVPGDTSKTDSVTIKASPGERVLTREENRDYERLRRGETSSQPIHVHNYIGGKKVNEYIYNETKNGNLMIHNRSVTSK